MDEAASLEVGGRPAVEDRAAAGEDQAGAEEARPP